MKCEELLKALNEYVDGAVDPAVCAEFRSHLEGCNPCQIVVDNVRQTITLYKEGKEFALPPALRARLHAALRRKFEAKFQSKA